MSPAVGAGVALATAALAVRAGWLTPPAALAAAAVGTAHLLGAGWTGGMLLAAFVVSGSLLTRTLDPAGRGAARRRPGQVLANGGPAALAALVVPSAPHLGWPLLLGMLATAQADTWATELGRTSPRPPRDLWTGRRMPPGTSGAVSWRGTVGGAAGGLVLGLLAWPAVGPTVATVGAAGGFIGMLLDSALGGSVQTRYICSVCGGETESARHCGGHARRTRGVPGLGNSAVNALSTAGGGLVALALSRWWCC